MSNSARGVAPQLRLSTHEFLFFSQFIEDRAGIKLQDNQRALVESRLYSRVLSLGLNSWTDYINYTKKDSSGKENEIIVNALTTNKTFFFREDLHNNWVVEKVIPIIQAKRSLRKNPLLAWSAASSMGQEAYSLAMRLYESTGDYFRILGTDINSNVVKKANMGVYSKDEVLGFISPDLLKKFWLRGKGDLANFYKVNSELGNNIKFRQHNLIKPSTKFNVDFDVIFLRNILYYFDSQKQKTIVQNAVNSLALDGFLFLGFSEAIEAEEFNLEYLGCSVYRKRDSVASTTVPRENKNSVEIKKQAIKKVLIIDDSQTIQKVLTRIINRDPELEVIGCASNPIEAVPLIEKFKPDVLSLDIDMPKMNGVEFLRKIWPKYLIPTVMVTSHSIREGGKVLDALDAGATDYIQKPSTTRIEETTNTICKKLKEISGIKVKKKLAYLSQEKEIKFNFLDKTVILIGSSTGGTVALQQILTELPKDSPPIVIVQHIPEGFSRSLAERLDELCKPSVSEAKNGDVLEPGHVYIAKGDHQLKVNQKGEKLVLEVNNEDPVNQHAPSVDYLFESALKIKGFEIVAGVLTGMGRDGANGMLKLKEQGSFTIAQDEETSVVYGMPRVAAEIGAATKIVPLNLIFKSIESFLNNR